MPTGSIGSEEEAALSRAERSTKQVILIRHGRSTWNEFLGAHKKSMWEEQEKNRTSIRSTVKNVVRWPAGGAGAGRRGSESGGYPDKGGGEKPQGRSSSLGRLTRERSRGFFGGGGGGGAALGGGALGGGAALGAAGQEVDLLNDHGGPDDEKVAGGFWQGVRGGLKHLGNSVTHANKLKQVDHQLSAGGVVEAQALRAHMSGVVQAEAAGTELGPEELLLLKCNDWYVSPFCRALQTGSFALGPLYRRKPDIKMTVTPQLNELVKSGLSQDCQGKKGNTGFRVVARALSKIAEVLEDDEDTAGDARMKERQEELFEVSQAITHMDLAQIAGVWWQDLKEFKKENLKLEDQRIKRLVAFVLKHEAPVVGLVAHSLIFQRLLQLFCPCDRSTQQDLRTQLRNGASPDGMDPFLDKMQNCGCLVLTFKYKELDEKVAEADRSDCEVVSAQWLFGGHMESVGGTQELEAEADESGMVGFADLDDFLYGSEPNSPGKKSSPSSPRGKKSSPSSPRIFK